MSFCYNPPHEPRIILPTLSVDDWERALAFYRDGLGCGRKGSSARSSSGRGGVFRPAAGLMLALWPRKHIAWDANLAQAAPSPTEFPSATTRQP
jgi:hypothetical protein